MRNQWVAQVPGRPPEKLALRSHRHGPWHLTHIYAFFAATGFLGATFFTAFFAVLGLVALGALGLSAAFLGALGLAAAALGLAAALTFFTPAALGLAGAAFFAPAAAWRGYEGAQRSGGHAGQLSPD